MGQEGPSSSSFSPKPEPSHRFSADSSATVRAFERTEDLLEAQNAVLKLLASGEPLKAVLDKLCCLFEEQRPGIYCSVLLVDKDGKTLRLGAAPNHAPRICEWDRWSLYR